VFKCERYCDRLFKIRRVLSSPYKQKRGDVVTTRNKPHPERSFSKQDILWALGIWSVILSLSPVVLFYVLMVN